MTSENPANDPSPPTQLRLAEVVGALSYALDLTEGQPPGHCLRCCWIGMHVGQELGIDPGRLYDLYYTLLLKDAGCSSNAARLCELYGSDDIQTKHDVKTVDVQSLRELGRFVFTHTGLNTGLWKRVKLMLHLIRQGEKLTQELITSRCERGAEIAVRLGFSERVADGVRSLDEHWNGKGRPSASEGEAIPLASRIALLAQVVDVFHQAGGADAAIREIRQRSGTWFDPKVVAAMEAVGESDEFWQVLAHPELETRVLELEPREGYVQLDDERLDAIAAGFGQVVDAKSPYTAGHSSRVAAYADAIAVRLGLDASRRRWLYRGALLHDIGKLGVSNTILDKPDKLDAAEWEKVQMHPVHTFHILSKIGPFADLAFVAGAHHERLDGTGYPWGLSHDEIPLETRIITVADIFDAITADRPYREGMPFSKALSVMESLRGGSLDPVCLDALLAYLPGSSDPRTANAPVSSLWPTPLDQSPSTTPV